MAWYFVIIMLVAACCVLSWLSSRLVKSLVEVAKFLRWKEFIIAFFFMAFAVSLPNLFVDINAVLHGMPELAFGDIIGGNLVDLTLVLGIATFFTKKGLSADSQIVQKSAVITTVIAILPIVLLLDGALQRVDGLLLIAAFFAYAFWIFSKREYFSKTYKTQAAASPKTFKVFLVNLGKIAFLLALLLGTSHVVVEGAKFFSEEFAFPIALVGILIVGLGNAFPELYFSIITARKEKNWLVLGDLMGSVIICSTLVLGTVILISPFPVADFSPFLVARAFLVVASLLSLMFIKSGKHITKKEGLLLLSIYICFLLLEIFLY